MNRKKADYENNAVTYKRHSDGESRDIQKQSPFAASTKGPRTAEEPARLAKKDADQVSSTRKKMKEDAAPEKQKSTKTS